MTEISQEFEKWPLARQNVNMEKYFCFIKEIDKTDGETHMTEKTLVIDRIY